MDLFDAIQVVPAAKARQELTRGQESVRALVLVGLPLLTAVILAVTDLSKQPLVAVVWIPAAFTTLAPVACLLARMGAWRIFKTSLACLLWCVAAGITLVVIDIMIFPF